MSSADQSKRKEASVSQINLILMVMDKMKDEIAYFREIYDHHNHAWFNVFPFLEKLTASQANYIIRAYGKMDPHYSRFTARNILVSLNIINKPKKNV